MLVLALAAGTLWGWAAWRNRPAIRSHRYDAPIRAAAARYGVEYALLKAVVRQESDFDPGVVGRAGEIGLMQLMPGAVSDWERSTGRVLAGNGLLFDPGTNLEIGTWYLGQALDQWRGHPDCEVLALVQYNAGRSRARQCAASPAKNVLEQIPIRSTKTYITHILEARSAYRLETR